MQWVRPAVAPLRCRTNVTFHPISLGSKSASFNVTAASVSQSVPLSATGVLASYTVAPGSLDFGSVSVG